MLAFTTALFTATIALLGKLVFDAWDRYRQRQGIAASVAGEMRAYMELLEPQKMASHIRLLLTLPRETRLVALSAFGPLPQTHPVFDKVADKIGLLSIDIALEISKFYNVVTGMRLLASGLSTERFMNLPDNMQTAQLGFCLSALEKHFPAGAKLADRLEVIARQSFRCYALQCGATANISG
jgi:hypothetical protein